MRLRHARTQVRRARRWAANATSEPRSSECRQSSEMKCAASAAARIRYSIAACAAVNTIETPRAWRQKLESPGWRQIDVDASAEAGGTCGRGERDSCA